MKPNLITGFGDSFQLLMSRIKILSNQVLSVMTNKRKKKKLTSAPDPIMKMGSAASSVAKNHWPSVLCILRGVTFKGQEAQYDLQMHKNTLSCEW